MKFFIAVSGLALLFGFGFSETDLFFLRYKGIINYCNLKDGKWESIVQNTEIERKNNLCNALAISPVFVDKSSENDIFSSSTREYSKVEFVVKETEVLVGYNLQTITTLSCQYNNSVVYLAKHSNCEHILLFELQDSHIPRLTGAAVRPMKFERLIMNVTRQFHFLLREYNSSGGYYKWSNANFVFQEEIKILQLCMTLEMFFDSTDNKFATNVVLKVSGSSQRIKKVIRVEERFENKVDETTALKPEYYEDEEEEQDNIDEEIIDLDRIIRWNIYIVPTIQCDVTTSGPDVMERSQTTFVFVPHPDSNHNGIFAYNLFDTDYGKMFLYSYMNGIFFVEPKL